MKHPLLALWALTGALSAAAPGGAWVWHQRARGRAAAESARLTEVVARSEELHRLRGRALRTPGGEGGESLAPKVSAVLGSAGLAPGALVSFSARVQPGAAAEGIRVVRRSASVVLSGLTLGRLGAFLDHWRRSEPAWTVASVEITPERGAGGSSRDGASLRVTLVLEAAVVEEQEAAP